MKIDNPGTQINLSVKVVNIDDVDIVAFKADTEENAITQYLDDTGLDRCEISIKPVDIDKEIKYTLETSNGFESVQSTIADEIFNNIKAILSNNYVVLLSTEW